MRFAARAAQQRLELEFATEGAVSQQELKEQMTQFFAQMDQQDRCVHGHERGRPLTGS